MAEQLSSILQFYNTYIGTYLLLFLLVPAGLYYTLKLRFIQLRRLRHAVTITSGKYDRDQAPGELNHFQALTAALAATVGTGNIAGVALAIAVGGPGAVFWLWVSGFLGMALKYAECTLAQRFRRVNDDGSVAGGPMYYIEEGLRNKLGRYSRVLALLFAGATIIATIGTGNMAQSNSMADALYSFVLPGGFQIPRWLSGGAMALLIAAVTLGGIRRIGAVAEKMVPFMALFYCAAALTVLSLYLDRVPGALCLIVRSAFTPASAAGGVTGAGFIMAMRYGIARGLFSNEAGQGSAPIAHAVARTRYPVREGLVSLLEPLIDTIIICTMTALVILVTGVWDGGSSGAELSYLAFERGLNVTVGGLNLGGIVVSFGLIIFAYTTALTWSFYGEQAVVYLLGKKAVKPYRIIYCVFVFAGALWSKQLVWDFVDTAMTLMALPNLLALFMLAPMVARMTGDYFDSGLDK